MAAAVAALLGNPARRQIEQSACARAGRDFDWDAIACHRAALYCGLTGR
jgi:hypothetical protein